MTSDFCLSHKCINTDLFVINVKYVLSISHNTNVKETFSSPYNVEKKGNDVNYY